MTNRQKRRRKIVKTTYELLQVREEANVHDIIIAIQETSQISITPNQLGNILRAHKDFTKKCQRRNGSQVTTYSLAKG